ncbi:Nitrilase/cyanide hydratase and apolipoprotein N-acyltransferase [Niveomyces insectorum RCEF 264]|uniref:Nitrilase/cyanide hydratase and apolipoprotein N-acyltransferase n=1 Tax=Niveomyces insectorum RCEF 264 TaxID=1081102 RepID=A0A167SHB8_9HYPO|nr:Nitrilase/cyanide hydratase and apolipoprotein N-acyltransferase [Niveomyces insectorum RCEF 264]
MAPLFKIALIQFEPKPVDVEANFAYAAAALRDAAAAGARLAVLPEYHLTSWVPDHPDFVAACAASGAYLPRYQALAKELDLCIAPGTIVEAHAVTDAATDAVDAADATKTLVTVADAAHGPFELRNMAYCLAAGTGAVLGRYQKTNLWHPERPHLVAPTAASAVGWPPHTAFDLPWTWPASGDNDNKGGRPVRAGLLVCWDLAFPEAFRALVADGADLIIVSSFWHPTTDVDAVALAHNPDCEVLFLRSALTARAYENTCAVAFCNACGLSQLAQPLVGGRGEVAPGTNATSLVDLDLDLLAVAEGNYRVRADMRRPGWHYAHTLAVPGGTKTAKTEAAAKAAD